MSSKAGRAQQIEQEQVRLIWRNAPFTLTANLALGGLMVWVLWHLVPPSYLLAWYAWDVALTLKGVIDYIPYREFLLTPNPKRVPCHADFIAARRSYHITAFATGCQWGAAALLPLASDSFRAQELILVATVGMAFGGAVFLSVFKRIFYEYILVIILPNVAVFSFAPQPYDVAFVGFSIALLFATMAFAINVHAVVLRMFALRFENIDLIEALTEQKKQAEYANLAKSRFLAAASHDLRQPMHALGLFMHTLAGRVRDSESAAIIGQMSASVEALEQMFNRLLDISKLDAGTQERTIQHFPLQSLLEQIRVEFQPEAQGKGLKCKLVPTRAYVRSDPVLLGRIVRNLVANALRYTEKGGIVVGCRRQGERVRLEVWDTGIGIPASQQKEIFQEFFQAHNPERDRSKGFGLGLAIVERLCVLLSHPVKVRSQPGRGSVFSVELPRGEAGSATTQDAYKPDIVVAQLSGTLIAAVDDDPAVIDGMRQLFDDWGCRLIAASSGDELVQALRKTGEAPAVIVSDYRLRDGETGADVIRRVCRELQCDIPGVLITGDTAPERIREAAASGYHVLHKPVRPTKIRVLLTQLLFG